MIKNSQIANKDGHFSCIYWSSIFLLPWNDCSYLSAHCIHVLNLSWFFYVFFSSYFFLFFIPAAAAAKSLQSCLTLCDPIDGSTPGSPVPGILQARTPEWVAISFSHAWKWKVKVKSLSCVRLLVTPWTIQPTRLLCPWDFPGKSTGVGCYCLLLFFIPSLTLMSFVSSWFIFLIYYWKTAEDEFLLDSSVT